MTWHVFEVVFFSHTGSHTDFSPAFRPVCVIYSCQMTLLADLRKNYKGSKRENTPDGGELTIGYYQQNGA